jgi:O-antigen/teichoic acid export membrane protein
MILIRSLTKAQMGTFALFLAVTSIFEAAKTNLLKNAHVRFVNTHDNIKDRTSIAASSFLINSLISLVFIVLILFFSNWLSITFNMGNELAIMLKWFIPGLIGMIFFSHLEAVQQSNLDFKGGFAGYFVRQLFFFLIITAHFIWKIPFTLKYLAIYQSASIALGAIVLFIYTRKYLHYTFNITRTWLKKILAYGSYIFSSGMIAHLFANLDQLITARFLNPAAVASYNAASRINGLVDIPSYAASEVIFPKISKASAEEGIGKVKYLYEKMVAVLLSFTTPAALFIILFPNLVISVIAGKEYLDAAPILQLYMITGILRPMQNQAANLLNSIGKPGLCLIINAVSLAVNLVINFLCLNYFGFYGAAIGTLITCLLGSTAWYFIMKKQIDARLKNIFLYMFDFYKLIYGQAVQLLTKKLKTII